MQKTLFNGISDNCCAYCNLHRCGMTVKQMRTKECLRKQCWHLVKNEQHDYWRYREVMKQKKTAKKETMNQYVINIMVQAN